MRKTKPENGFALSSPRPRSKHLAQHVLCNCLSRWRATNVGGGSCEPECHQRRVWSRDVDLPIGGEDAEVADVDDAVVVEIAVGEGLSRALPVGGEHAKVGYVDGAIMICVAGEREEVERDVAG